MTYLVAGNVPAALGHELLDALVDVGAGSDDLVLYILSDIQSRDFPLFCSISRTRDIRIYAPQ